MPREFQIVYKVNNQTVRREPIKFQQPSINIQTVNLDDEINCEEVSLSDFDEEQFEAVRDEDDQKMFEVNLREPSEPKNDFQQKCNAIFQSINLRSSEFNPTSSKPKFIILEEVPEPKLKPSNPPVTYEISSESDDDVIEVKNNFEVIKNEKPKNEMSFKIEATNFSKGTTSNVHKLTALELPQNVSIKEEPELEINDSNVIEISKNDLKDEADLKMEINEEDSESELQIDSVLELVFDEDEGGNVIINEESETSPALLPATEFFMDPYRDFSSFAIDDPNKIFNCLYCPRTFTNKFNFMTHQTFHANYNYRCQTCLRKFKLINNFQNHICVRCDECGEIFRNESLKFVHMEKDHQICLKVDENFFECDLCGLKFKQHQRLKYHMHDFHTKVEATIKCKFCDQKLKYKRNLQRHLKTHEEPIKCEFCSEKIVPIRMNFHLINAHGLNHKGKCIKKFNCKICGLRFKEKKCLYQHLQWHENPDIFRCHVCSKSFPLKTFLRIHRKVHERSLTCPRSGCSYSTNSQFKLDEHEKKHERKEKFLEAKKDWIKCEHCHVYIKNKLKLSSHVWKTHPEKMM